MMNNKIVLSLICVSPSILGMFTKELTGTKCWKNGEQGKLIYTREFSQDAAFPISITTEQKYATQKGSTLVETYRYISGEWIEQHCGIKLKPNKKNDFEFSIADGIKFFSLVKDDVDVDPDTPNQQLDIIMKKPDGSIKRVCNACRCMPYIK